MWVQEALDIDWQSPHNHLFVMFVVFPQRPCIEPLRAPTANGVWCCSFQGGSNRERWSFAGLGWRGHGSAVHRRLPSHLAHSIAKPLGKLLKSERVPGTMSAVNHNSEAIHILKLCDWWRGLSCEAKSVSLPVVMYRSFSERHRKLAARAARSCLLEGTMSVQGKGLAELVLQENPLITLLRTLEMLSHTPAGDSSPIHGQGL